VRGKGKVEGVAGREARGGHVVLLGCLVQHKQLLLEVEVVWGEEVGGRVSPWHRVGVGWIASPWEVACVRPSWLPFCLVHNILCLSLLLRLK